MSDVTTLVDVCNELHRARSKHADFTKRHEAYAVILEELDEVKDVVWHDGQDKDLRGELLQVAAMAIRAIVDLKLT